MFFNHHVRVKDPSFILYIKNVKKHFLKIFKGFFLSLIYIVSLSLVSLMSSDFWDSLISTTNIIRPV